MPITPNTLGSASSTVLDDDLTVIAGLSPSNDDVLQRKSGAWANRTPAQLKIDLSVADAANGGLETVQTHGATGATETIDLANGNYHIVTQDQSCTYTFSGATNGKACAFTLKFTAVTGTATWPASVKWADATAPTLSGVTILTFISDDGGTTWYGGSFGKAFA